MSDGEVIEAEARLPTLRLEIIRVFLQRNNGALMEDDGSRQAFEQIAILLRTAAGLSILREKIVEDSWAHTHHVSEARNIARQRMYYKLGSGSAPNYTIRVWVKEENA